MSLAWDGSGETPAAFFRDITPTLGSANLSAGAQNVSVGPGCNGAPTLVATSAPAFGNLDLFLQIDSNQSNMLALLFVGVGTIDVPVINPGCRFYVDTSDRLRPGLLRHGRQRQRPAGPAAARRSGRSSESSWAGRRSSTTASPSPPSR